MTVRISTLDNGLRVVTDNLPGVHSATLGLWVEVGTRNETPDVNGISHFLEHMAFKGTARRSARQIVEEIESVGGHLNAYTSRENTAYHARVLEADVPLALDIIADILQNSTFLSEEVDRERHVILQEIGQALDTPDDVIFDHFQMTAFPDQPMGRPILGPSEVVKRISRDDLVKYIAKEYAASRMVFSATGAVDHDQIVDLCQQKFTNLSTHMPEEYIKAQYLGGNHFYNRDLEQVHLLLGYESCAYGEPDHFPLTVLSSLLGGGMSSRLFQEVREKKGLVYSIYSFNSMFRDSGVFGIYAGTGEHQVDELLPTVRGILDNFSKDLSDEEIQRSKAQLKASILMSLESTSARCEQLAQQLMIYKRHIPPQEIIDKVNAVRREDIVGALSKLLQKKPTFAALGPGKEIHWE